MRPYKKCHKIFFPIFRFLLFGSVRIRYIFFFFNPVVIQIKYINYVKWLDFLITYSTNTLDFLCDLWKLALPQKIPNSQHNFQIKPLDTYCLLVSVVSLFVSASLFLSFSLWPNLRSLSWQCGATRYDTIRYNSVHRSCWWVNSINCLSLGRYKYLNF